jgi:serine/threonine protein phosphatase 1
MPARTIAIGDVHGCSRALVALLEMVKPVSDDVIVTLGDYVNRGPDSREVIERLIALERECTVVPILGNHDQQLLAAMAREPGAFFDLLDMGGGATLTSYGSERAADADLARIPDEHVEFLKRCRDYYETHIHIFVHAQYDPDLPMREQPSYLLRWESLRDVSPGPHTSGKTVIAGHTQQRTGEVLDLGHLVCIDTACYAGGWLTALDVHTREIWQVSRHGEPRTSRRH